MDKLKFINEQMDVLALPYEFGEWTSEVKYPYYVGEFTEEGPNTEDGYVNTIFTLNGFHRGSYMAFEEDKAKIRQHFHPIHGLRARTDSGAIVVYFDGAFYIPTNEAELKRIQINLIIKEWKGDL